MLNTFPTSLFKVKLLKPIKHYGQEIADNRIQRIRQEGLERSHFHERQPTITEFNQTYNYSKRGLAITPVKFGISLSRNNSLFTYSIERPRTA
jgi:xanthine dehydrogenase molybdopterin-binding subunit B